MSTLRLQNTPISDKNMSDSKIERVVFYNINQLNRKGEMQ